MAAVTLEQIARALGENSRMLVHHFGSRDELIRAALREAREQQLAAFRAHLHSRPVGGLEELVEVLREFVSAPDNQPHLRLFAEVAALAAQDPGRFPGFPEATVRDWLPHLQAKLVDAGHSAVEAEALGTLGLAVVRGLLLDRTATGESSRVEAAYTAFLRRCAPSASQRRGGPAPRRS